MARTRWCTTSLKGWHQQQQQQTTHTGLYDALVRPLRKQGGITSNNISNNTGELTGVHAALTRAYDNLIRTGDELLVLSDSQLSICTTAPPSFSRFFLVVPGCRLPATFPSPPACTGRARHELPSRCATVDLPRHAIGCVQGAPQAVYRPLKGTAREKTAGPLTSPHTHETKTTH